MVDALLLIWILCITYACWMIYKKQDSTRRGWHLATDSDCVVS